MRLLAAIIVGQLSIIIAAAFARADIVTWLHDIDSYWNFPTNWSSNPAVPGPNDDVVIDRPGFATVTISSGSTTTTTAHSLICNNTLIIYSPLSLAADSQVGGTLDLRSGTLTSDGNLVITGQFKWSSGTLGGTGVLKLRPGSVTTIADTFGTRTLSKVIDNEGTFNLAATTGFAGISFSNGTINNLPTGTFNILVSGTSFDGAATDSFNNAGTFNVSSSNIRIPFNNIGTVNLNSGNLLFEHATSSGTVNVFPGGALQGDDFTNTGIINLRGPSSLNSNSGGFNNAVDGRINVLSGLSSLSNAKNSGSINVAAGASFTLANCDQLPGSKITGSGALTLSNIANFSGSLESTGPITITVSTNFNSNQMILGPFAVSSTLGGTGNLTIGNSFNWRTGDITSGGKLTFASTSMNSISLTGNFKLGRVLENAGIVTYDSGIISLSTGGRISNLSGGIFNAFAFARSWGALPFDNAGTLNFEGGTTSSPPGGTAINNSGTINVAAGVATIGGNNSGTINVASGASITRCAEYIRYEQMLH